MSYAELSTTLRPPSYAHTGVRERGRVGGSHVMARLPGYAKFGQTCSCVEKNGPGLQNNSSIPISSVKGSFGETCICKL